MTALVDSVYMHEESMCINMVAVHDRQVTCRLLARPFVCTGCTYISKTVFSELCHVMSSSVSADSRGVHAGGMNAALTQSTTAGHAEHVHERFSARLVAQALPNSGP